MNGCAFSAFVIFLLALGHKATMASPKVNKNHSHKDAPSFDDLIAGSSDSGTPELNRHAQKDPLEFLLRLEESQKSKGGKLSKHNSRDGKGAGAGANHEVEFESELPEEDSSFTGHKDGDGDDRIPKNGMGDDSDSTKTGGKKSEIMGKAASMGGQGSMMKKLWPYIWKFIKWIVKKSLASG